MLGGKRLREASLVVIAHAGVSDAWVLFDWTPEAPLLVGLTVAAIGWIVAVRLVDARHPRTPVPRWRSAAFLAGLLTLLVALQSPIDTYADDWLSVHMVQHLLLGFVAAPLFVLAGPMLLALRLAPASVRRRFILPLLASRVVRLVTFPGITWGLFGAVMWIAHFSPLFELALENDVVHQAEHLLFLGSGFLYWLPALGSEPLPWRLGWSGRLLYLVLGMPVSTVLGMLIVAQTSVLYPAYLGAGVGAALADQRLAGALMWVGGDLISVVLVGVLVIQWLRAEAARVRRRASRPRCAPSAPLVSSAERVPQSRPR